MTKTFKLYQDWLDKSPEAELTVHPILHDPYKLFLYILLTTEDGLHSLDGLKRKFRMFGLRNGARIGAAIEYLIQKAYICTDVGKLNHPMAFAYLNELTAGTPDAKVVDADMDLMGEIHNHKRRVLAEGKLTVRSIDNEFSAAAVVRRGFKLFDGALLYYPELQGRSGKLLQLYVYLILSASFKDRQVFMQEEWLQTFKVKIFRGESLVGMNTLAGKFNISSRTVRKDLSALIGTGLVSSRTGKNGRSKIYRIMNYDLLQDYKTF